jgi:PTS system N-acetylglucosamine-specific IIC component
MVTMDLLGTRLGFSFSAGFFDYVLNFGKATHPLYLIPVGALYFGLYYGLFRYFIVKLDLKTPGREPLDAATPAAKGVRSAGGAEGFVIALGGAANLTSVDACTTRLRLVLVDRSKVDEPALKALGARGMIAVGPNGLQVVVGPIADQVASDIRAWLAGGNPSGALDASSVLEALGGRANVLEAAARPGRVLVTVGDGAAVKADALVLAGLRGVARPAPLRLHLLHPDATALAAALANRDQR